MPFILREMSKFHIIPQKIKSTASLYLTFSGISHIKNKPVFSKIVYKIICLC